MSITVPSSPVVANLAATSTARPVVVRAHARRRPTPVARISPRESVVQAQRKRVRKALARWQGQAWRGITDPLRDRAFDAWIAELTALDVLLRSPEFGTVAGS